MGAITDSPILENDVDISIIIVNYKVKDYVCLLLNSIERAKEDLNVEIFVVDNNSDDGSVEYIGSKFPRVQIIDNKSNTGFGKANNQAIIKARGKYTFLINPDTVISEKSLVSMKNYMDNNEDCGATGFKLINPDGSYARECKRSVPDLKSAVFRVLGLDKLFPKNKFIGKRYLSWLPENEVHKIPVISGAAMFWRTSLLTEMKGFDEDFFMYGEDDDLCYRVQGSGYHLSYVPASTILHFKGESEQSVNFRHVKKVNKGLLLFFQKHYRKKYNRIEIGLINAAYYARIFILYVLLSFKNTKGKTSNKRNSLIVISKSDQSYLIKNLEDKNYSYSVIKSSEELTALEELVKKKHKDFKSKPKVVFDLNSVSIKSAFSLMSNLKEEKLDFHFWLEKENKIIGKSSVIDLDL